MGNSTLIVEEGYNKVRIDKYFAIMLPELSRSLISNSIIKANGKEVKPSFKVSENDKISLDWEETVYDKIVPIDIPLDILYEDEYLIVINKAYDMVVHPGSGNYTNTLVNALAYYLGDDYTNLDPTGLRPGIVHRLDKETTGVMVIAKTLKVQENLVKQFSKRSIVKHYYAIVKNIMGEKSGVINTNIVRDKYARTKFTTSTKEGKEALTEFEVIQNFEDSALIDVHLHTGRTHQIRVHFLSINHPLIGDTIYNKKDKEHQLMLQSYHLDFKHPITKERMIFDLEIAPRLKNYALSKDPNFSL